MNTRNLSGSILVAVAALALLFQSCITAGAESGAIKITGTGSSIGTMQRLVEFYHKKNPGAAVTILTSIGSTGGIKAVKANKIDIGLSSRAMRPDERAPDLFEVAYGRTPFVFATHRSNSQSNITFAEIANIYAGKQRSWPDKTPVRLVLRPRTDAYTVFLESLNENIKQASRKSYQIPGLFTGITDQDAADQIEKTQGSFGVTSLSLILSEDRKIKVLSLDGVAPSVANLESGKYPCFMTMHLIHKNSNPAVKRFIDFVFSREGQKILRDNGHQPLKKTSVI